MVVNNAASLGVPGRILLSLSKCADRLAPVAVEPRAPKDGTSLDRLDRLVRVRPSILEDFAGKRILDHGCGTGRQAVELARRCGATVVGVEIQENLLEEARVHARAAGVGDRVQFKSEIGPPEIGRFDWVVSQNAMEHFHRPVQELRRMNAALRSGGRILVTFGPTWLSPYGAHMRYFTPIPWVHLLFSEQTVMAVRGRFRDDGARRYEDVVGGLNRMTVSKFERCVREAGLQTEELGFGYVRNLRVLGAVPKLREFVTNQVTAVLSA